MNENIEVRALNSLSEIIESIVNYSVCRLPENKDELVTEVFPKNNISKKYFYILILELFSPVNKEYFPDKAHNDSLLTTLDTTLENPLFGLSIKSKLLKQRVVEFLTWVDTEFTYEIYSQNISKELEIKLTRKDALYLIGNRCKHALPRSNLIAKKLVNIYKQSGLELQINEEIKILGDIDIWLLDDFGGYHFTKLCELCSNIYHAVHEYISLESDIRTIHHEDGRYSYDIPSNINDFEFYELFNRFRQSRIPKISTNKYLQYRY